MKTSDLVDKISADLALAEGKMGVAEKDAVNPRFNSGYATLSSSIRAVKGVLSEHGIAVVQAPYMDGMTMMLETRLMHKSGQWISSECPVIQFPALPQAIGAALTYMRRFALMAICSIAPDEPDDDANSANQTPVSVPNTLLEVLNGEMKNQKTLEELDAWQSKNIPRINKLTDKEKDALRKDYSKRREELNKADELEAAE